MYSRSQIGVRLVADPPINNRIHGVVIAVLPWKWLGRAERLSSSRMVVGRQNGNGHGFDNTLGWVRRQAKPENIDLVAAPAFVRNKKLLALTGMY